MKNYYFLGFNRIGIASTDQTAAKWGSSEPGYVSSGLWGSSQPGFTVGDCTAVTLDFNQANPYPWNLKWCGQKLPYFCQQAADVAGNLVPFYTC